MFQLIPFATRVASVTTWQVDDKPGGLDWNQYGLPAPSPSYYVSPSFWNSVPVSSTPAWSYSPTTTIPPTATVYPIPATYLTQNPDITSSPQPLISSYSAPIDHQHLTETTVVRQIVDVTVTADVSAGTSVCSLPSPPMLPALPTTLPFPATCVLPSSPLTNEEQVGGSLWGSLCQPYFPEWLANESGQPYESAPWGDRTTQTHDAVIPEDIPTTNVTRYYDFTITRGQISADGVLRDVMLVNDQFPGPAIEANWGDWIEITVHNNISYPLEGTALHWHGFLQRGNNWADGVPSVSQCPIAPSHSYTYRIPAQLYGTTWYHAHLSAQYTAGVLGPMIVYGPSQLQYDIDIGPVMLSDWYHVPYFSLVSDAVGTDMSVIPPVSDSLLINGRGRFDCSAPSFGNETELLASSVASTTQFTCVDGAEFSKFKFQPGKVHRLRLMNVGADGIQKFSIDGHDITVIAYDFVPIKPQTTKVVTLGVGQRADVLVTADNHSANMFWMRTTAPGGPMCGGSAMSEVTAAVYYEGADVTGVPATVRDVNDTLCENDALAITEPEYSITPSENSYHFDVSLTLELNSTGSLEWRMNNQTFRANFNFPSLYLAAEGNTSYPYDPQWNVVNFGLNTSVVVNITNGTPLAHPFHLHGHNFYVLNTGPNGTLWDGSVVNPQNPTRRDTQIVPAQGFVAIAFEADNPGVWPFHCHVAWHLSGGLAMNFITHPESIPAMPEGERDRTCADWQYYSDNNVVDQIDAGS